MGKSINKFLEIDDQIKHIQGKGLVFKSQESLNVFKEYLKQYNYTTFIKNYSFKELFGEDNKYLNTLCSDDIRYIYDLDRTISIILWKYLKGIETHFNTSLTLIVSREVEKESGAPYFSLLNFNQMNKIFSNASILNQEGINNKTKKLNSIELLNDIFYRNLYTVSSYMDINNHNENSEHADIISDINKNLENEKVYKLTSRYKYRFVHIQSLFTSLTINSSFKIYKCLSDELQTKVIKEFLKFILSKKHMPSMKKESFIEIMEILMKLRNFLAHNEKIIDFRFTIHNENLCDVLNKILPFKLQTNKEIKLQCLIKFIQYIRDLSGNKIIKEIEQAINNKRSSSKNGLSEFVENLILKKIGIK